MKILNQFFTLLTHPNNKGKEIQTVIRIISWKINQLFFKFPKVVKLTDSCKIVCYPSSSYASFIIYARFPEYYEMNFIQSVVKKNWIFFDVGANIGAISLLAASKVTIGTVHAFEPTPSLAKNFNENVALNSFQNKIFLHKVAVSNKVGTVGFSCETESEVNHISIKGKKDSRVITVSSTTLDLFTKEKIIPQIDFLKIDVEGAELLVFQGSKRLLKAGKIGIILFELNKKSENFGYSYHRIFTLLSKYNYSFFSFDKQGFFRSVIAKKYVLNHTENIIAVQKKSEYFASCKKYM